MFTETWCLIGRCNQLTHQLIAVQRMQPVFEYVYNNICRDILHIPNVLYSACALCNHVKFLTSIEFYDLSTDPGFELWTRYPGFTIHLWKPGSIFRTQPYFSGYTQSNSPEWQTHLGVNVFQLEVHQAKTKLSWQTYKAIYPLYQVTAWKVIRTGSRSSFGMLTKTS